MGKSMANQSPTSKLDKVTFKDWSLALIGLLFTLSGLLIIKDDFKLGITILAFFSACFAVDIHIILRKLRLQRQTLLTVTIVGGQQIRPPRMRLAMLGFGLLIVGVTLTISQPENNIVFFGVALFMAVIGVALLVGLATGLLTKNYIQFDPPGITFGYAKGNASVPWSAITKVARGEINRNQAVFLWVEQEGISAEPASYLAMVQKHIASAQEWTGADFVIMSSSYGIDAPILLAAMERYITIPDVKSELQATPKLRD